MLARFLLAVSVLSILSSSASSSGTATRPCQRGPESWAWDLPEPQMSDGFVDGKLYDSAGHSLLQFRATLTDVPSPCLSCIEGEIHGTLDDGGGGAPEYIVTGQYRGNFLARQGSFTALLYPYGSLTATGKMQGQFSDPYTDPDRPGQFRGQWTLCR